MFDDVLKTRLDRRLFAVAVFLSVITLSTGAAAVHEHESRIAERQQAMILVAHDVGVELPD